MVFDRASGIGGSDISAILGVNPYRSEFDVYLEKTRDPAWSPEAENARMRLGKLLEPTLRLAYEQDHPSARVYPHPSGPFDAEPIWHSNRLAYAHLDGSIDDPSGGGLWEGKSARNRRDWQEGVPDYYESQVRQYLAITGEPWCDLTVLFLDSAEFEHYRLMADADVDSGVIEAGQLWWQEHVPTRTPPMIDGSEGAAAFLSTRQSDSPILEPVLIAPPDIDEIGRRLALVRHNQDMSAEARMELENQIKALMVESGHAKIKGTGWRASYKRSKPAIRVGWEQVAGAYREAMSNLMKAVQTTPGKLRDSRMLAALQFFTDESLDAIVGMYTTQDKPAHPFVFRSVEEED